MTSSEAGLSVADLAHRWRGLLDRIVRLSTSVSVRAKISGIPAMLVMLVGLSLAVVVRLDTEHSMRAELLERGTAIARETAMSATEPILVNDVYGLSRLVKRTKDANRDVRYVLVLDGDGRVLADTFPGGVPASLPLDTRTSRTFESNEGLVHDIRYPVLDGDVGVVRVGLAGASLDLRVWGATLRVLLVTGIVLLFALTAGFGLAGLISRPIADLASATERVGSGETSYRLSPVSEDEIGSLTRSFNDMLDRLEETNLALATRQHDIEAMNAITAAAGKSLEIDAVVSASVRTAVDAFGAEAGWLLLGDESSELAYCTIEGFEPCSETVSACLCSQVMESAEARFVRIAEAGCGHLEEVAGGESRDSGWLACIPLIAESRGVGVLGLTFAGESNLADEADLVLALGTQVGAALQNARLWEEVQRHREASRRLLGRVVKAQEEERKRIARELHDETGQALTSLGLGLRRLRDRAGPGERTELADLHATAASALEGVARLALALRPAALDELGFVPALKDLAARLASSSGIELDVETVGLDGERLPGEVEVVLYRIIQEALTNVCRHSSATRADVLVQRRLKSVVADVEDDGRGFDMHEMERRGPESALGIFGMRERADLVGGTVSIESVPGRGTSVHLRLPLP